MIIYGGKIGNEYSYFFETPYQLQMCGISKKNIHKVELQESENGTYWGIQETGSDKYDFVFPRKMETLMCSPDSWKSDIAEGKVRLVQLELIELDG